MNREFLLNISFLILINVIIKPFYILAIEVNVQNAVGPENYGIFFALFNFCYLFQIINDLGIQNYNSRNISQNKSVLSQQLPSILGTKIVLSFIFVFLVLIVAFILGYSTEIFALLLLIAFNQVLQSFLLYMRTNIAASGLYRVDSIISVVDKVILVLILGYLLWIAPGRQVFKIEWFVQAQTVSLAITLIVAFVVNIKLVKKLQLLFSFGFSKDLLKKSIPFAIIIFLMIAYTRMDGVMLERLLDDNGYAAGVYAAGFRLLEASNMIGFLFAGLLLPMFSSLLKKRNELFVLIQTSFSLLFSISIIICLVSVFFRHEIMSFLYPEFADAQYGTLLSLLMISYVAMSLGYIFGTLLTANGDLKELNVVFFVGILINLGLNLYLIPQEQFIGAAKATIFTQYAVLLGQILLSYKHFKFKIGAIKILQHVAFVGLCLLVFWILTNYVTWAWIYKMILGIILAFIISLVLKLIDIKNFRASFINN